MPLPKPLSKDDIMVAIRSTKSNRAAARYLHCSYSHYKKYAKLYSGENGVSLFDVHKNQSGSGIPKFLSDKGKLISVDDIISGKIPTEHFTPQKIRDRLIQAGYLIPKCYSCGHSEQRVLDGKQPLILSFKDKNKKNYEQGNVELLCYNCYFLYIGNVLSDKQIVGLEDYVPHNQSQVDWEIDDSYIEHLQSLGLWEEAKTPGDEYIARE
jgi:hypothetical protein